MIRIGSLDAAPDRFEATLAALPLPPDAFFFARWPFEARLGSLRAPRGALAEAPQGRVFWAGGELRWQRLERGVRLVYVGEDAFDAPGLPVTVVERVQTVERELLVQGERVIDIGQLPGCGPDQVLAIVRREYATAEHGRFERFAGVVARRCDELAGRD
jgi:hypothetical protein